MTPVPHDALVARLTAEMGPGVYAQCPVCGFRTRAWMRPGEPLAQCGYGSPPGEHPVVRMERVAPFDPSPFAVGIDRSETVPVAPQVTPNGPKTE